MLGYDYKQTVNLYISPEVLGEIDDYANLLGQSRSAFIREALKVYLKQLKKHLDSLEEQEKTLSA